MIPRQRVARWWDERGQSRHELHGRHHPVRLRGAARVLDLVRNAAVGEHRHARQAHRRARRVPAQTLAAFAVVRRDRDARVDVEARVLRRERLQVLASARVEGGGEWRCPGGPPPLTFSGHVRSGGRWRRWSRTREERIRTPDIPLCTRAGAICAFAGATCTSAGATLTSARPICTPPLAIGTPDWRTCTHARRICTREVA
jgi:hypothetical protein